MGSSDVGSRIHITSFEEVSHHLRQSHQCQQQEVVIGKLSALSMYMNNPSTENKAELVASSPSRIQHPRPERRVTIPSYGMHALGIGLGAPNSLPHELTILKAQLESRSEESSCDASSNQKHSFMTRSESERSFERVTMRSTFQQKRTDDLSGICNLSSENSSKHTEVYDEGGIFENESSFLPCGPDVRGFSPCTPIQNESWAVGDADSQGSDSTIVSLGDDSRESSGMSAEVSSAWSDMEAESPLAANISSSHDNGGKKMKGLSSFFGGKSRSFTSLADVASIQTIQELAKPANPYAKRRSPGHLKGIVSERLRPCSLKMKGDSASRRPFASRNVGSRNLAMALLRTAQNGENGLETLIEASDEGKSESVIMGSLHSVYGCISIGTQRKNSGGID